MERKYYDYANNHDGFDIYQDFDYHGDERKQTRTRRRKWEKVRRRGKVKSILNYPRKKYDMVEKAKVLSKSSKSIPATGGPNLIRHRLKLRARGQLQTTKAEASFKSAKSSLKNNRKSKSIRKKARKNAHKINKLLTDVKQAAPQPDWLIKAQEPIPSRSIIRDIRNMREVRDDRFSKFLLPPRSRSDLGTAASSSIHTEHELYTQRDWQPRTPIQHLAPDVMDHVRKSLGMNTRIEESLVDLHRTTYGTSDTQSKMASLEWFTYRYPILLQRDKFAEDNAVTTIGKAWRAFLARRAYKEILFIVREKERAATKIQRMYRTRLHNRYTKEAISIMKGIIVNYCIDAGLENRVKALREEEKLERIRLKKIKEKRWAEKAEERRKKREIWLEKEKIRLAKEALERKRQNSANKIQQLRKSFKLRKEISNRIEIRRRRYFAAIMVQKHVRAKQIQKRNQEIYSHLKKIRTARIQKEAAIKIQRTFMYFRGKKWKQRMLYGLYICKITGADYEIPSPNKLHRWIFMDDPDYVDPVHRDRLFTEMFAHSPNKRTNQALRAKRHLMSSIELAHVYHMTGRLKSAQKAWHDIILNRIGNAKPTQRSVAYISQLILVMHARGTYEAAEPWIMACDDVVKLIEHQKKMARLFFVRIVAGPCWRALELIHHRAKKKRRKAAEYFASLAGKKRKLIFIRWKFYTEASVFNRIRLKSYSIRTWKNNVEFLKRLKATMRSILNGNMKRLMYAWREAADEEKRLRWVRKLAKVFASRTLKRNALRKWMTYLYYRKVLGPAINNINQALYRLMKEAMRIWKWFPSPYQEKWAALRIQATWRMHLGKRRFRMFWRRRALQQLLDEEKAVELAKLNAAASKIQGLFRIKKAWARRMDRVVFLIQEKHFRDERLKELLFDFQEVKEELSYIGSTPDTVQKLQKKAKQSSVNAERVRKGLRIVVRKEKDELRLVIKKTAPKIVKSQCVQIAKEIRSEGRLLGREKKKVDGQVRRAVKEFKKKCTDKREKAYARYKRFLELQKRNKDDIERYRIYEEKCDAEVEKFLELDEIEQVERKIKEAKQQIIDDSAKRITALFRGNMVYKRTNRLLQLNRNKKVLDIWAAETVQTWWRFVFARGIARQKRERKAFEDKSGIRLKYLRKLRGKKSAGDSREKLYLSRLDRIKLTDDNVKKVIDKFEEKVIKKLRLKEETITKIEKILEKKPRLEKRWNKYFPSVFKPPNWGKQDYTKPSVCLDRFFNDMHEVVLDFVAAQIPFKEEGPYAYIKVKIAVKQVNRLMKVFKNSVKFDVHSITAGILERGGKLCLKPVTFDGFSGSGGVPLKPQIHGIWRVPVYHANFGWLRQSRQREASFNFKNATFGADMHMSMQAIMKKLELQAKKQREADQAKVRMREEQEQAAEENKKKSREIAKVNYLEHLEDDVNVDYAYQLLGGERVKEDEIKLLDDGAADAAARRAAELLANELALVPAMEGELDIGTDEELSKKARGYKPGQEEHYSEYVMCAICELRHEKKRPAARLCHKCAQPYCNECWRMYHGKHAYGHNWTKIDIYHNALRDPVHEKHIERTEQDAYLLHLQIVNPQRYAVLQYKKKWLWSDQNLARVRQMFVDIDKGRTGRIEINDAANVCRVILGKRSDELPVVKVSLLRAWKVNKIPDLGITFSELQRLFVPFYEYLKINMRERLKLKVASEGAEKGTVDFNQWRVAKNKKG